MKELKRVLIMAGGTGGHIFPGLAIATYLREKGIHVDWLGTAQGLESRLVPEANFPLHLISISGLRGKGLKSKLLAPLTIAKAIFQARQVIKTVKPDVVIGMGGFASGPGGIASRLSGCPLIIHEQNAKAGMTNKWLARFAKRVLEGFPKAFPSEVNTLTVGNPVRVDIEALSEPAVRFRTHFPPFRLLVLGGSLGAQAINDLVPEAVSMLDVSMRPQIIHQTGEKHFQSTKKLYDTYKVNAQLFPFIKNMAEAYGWADVVLCRAGALTVAELCAAGVGAIFVPYPHAVDDHQTANASFMVNHKAAECIQQTELTAARLADMIKELSASHEKYLAMAEAAYQLRTPRVAEKVYEICQEVCR